MKRASSRTHSIMRIATTASPVSGADVRERTHLLKLSTRVKRSLEIVSFAWHRFKQRKTDEVIRQVRATQVAVIEVETVDGQTCIR